MNEITFITENGTFNGSLTQKNTTTTIAEDKSITIKCHFIRRPEWLPENKIDRIDTKSLLIRLPNCTSIIYRSLYSQHGLDFSAKEWNKIFDEILRIQCNECQHFSEI